MRRIASATLLCSALCALTPAMPLRAQSPAPAPPPAHETPEQFAARTKWWRDARFGMFIHWGVYAVPADATDKDGHKRIAEWYYSNKQMPLEQYEQFAKEFNPVRFDAHAWVKMAKDAGMKYIVITSKHHDGFDMFGTQQNHDWNIVAATPFHRDPIKELAAECKRQGIRLCFYHSIMDWHHPDYLPRRAWDHRPTDNADYDRYVAYLKAQLRELITAYHPGVLWFDGEWEPTWTHERGADLYAYVRGLQPDILINNRVDKGRQGMHGMSKSAEFYGDFGTPEQEIPPAGFPDGRLWESCMTMNDTWGYAKNDTNWKSTETLVRNLIDIASKGGNFLLNVGPTAEGEFPEAIQERLAGIAAWMKVNGDSIHGTTHSPFATLPFDGRCTQKGDTLYLHVYRWPGGGLTLSGLRTAVRSARALTGDEKLTFWRATDGSLTFAKPAKLDPIATVVELKLAGPPVVAQQGAAAVKAAAR